VLSDFHAPLADDGGWATCNEESQTQADHVFAGVLAQYCQWWIPTDAVRQRGELSLGARELRRAKKMGDPSWSPILEFTDYRNPESEDYLDSDLDLPGSFLDVAVIGESGATR
jgi:hypothetical protein